jgi:hypothetical protein|nr:MAG TPA: hypothetical protein [Caudoviricetes sp.]
MVNRDLRVFKDHKALKEILVHKVLLENRGLKETKESRVSREYRGLLELMEPKAIKEIQVLKVFKVQPEPMVRMDILRLKERITGRPQTNRKLLMMY